MKMVECSSFITNFCYIFSNVNGIEKPDKYGQQFLFLFNTIARSTCCNLSLNTMITRQKHRIANILNSRAFFTNLLAVKSKSRRLKSINGSFELKKAKGRNIVKCAQKKHFSYIID